MVYRCQSLGRIPIYTTALTVLWLRFQYTQEYCKWDFDRGRCRSGERVKTVKYVFIAVLECDTSISMSEHAVKEP